MLKKRLFISSIFLLLTSSCAYKLGYSNRQLPGGHQKVAIPMFENKTQYTGLESPFTDHLRGQFAKSKVAKVVNSNIAPAVIQGTILDVQVYRGGVINANNEEEQFTDNSGASNSENQLPDNTILATEYRVIVSAEVKLIDKASQRQLWQGQFSGERTYTAPQVRSQDLNSANALYNDDARRMTITNISQDIMAEAHDRMSENF